MELKLEKDTILDVIGTAAGAYLCYYWAGGEPIGGFAQLVPFVAAAVGGFVIWRMVRKNNRAAAK